MVRVPSQAHGTPPHRQTKPLQEARVADEELGAAEAAAEEGTETGADAVMHPEDPHNRHFSATPTA